MRLSIHEKAYQVFNTILLSIVGLFTLYPLIFMLVLSFNEGIDSTKGGLYLFPRMFTLFNYQIVLNNPNILSAYFITVSRTLIGTVLSVLFTAIVAYGLSNRNLPYRRVLVVIMLIPMLFSGGLVPYYLQLHNLHLLNNYLIYIIPPMFSIWNMFIMRRFFMEIPESLQEAATIDGANYIQILVKIIFPVSMPMLAAISLFCAVGHWNDWFAGAYFVDNVKLIPLQTFLYKLLNATDLSAVFSGMSVSKMSGQESYMNSQLSKVSLASVKMATVIVSTLPVLCVYPFLQKYFVKGVLIGSIKE